MHHIEEFRRTGDRVGHASLGCRHRSGRHELLPPLRQYHRSKQFGQSAGDRRTAGSCQDGSRPCGTRGRSRVNRWRDARPAQGARTFEPSCGRPRLSAGTSAAVGARCQYSDRLTLVRSSLHQLPHRNAYSDVGSQQRSKPRFRRFDCCCDTQQLRGLFHLASSRCPQRHRGGRHSVSDLRVGNRSAVIPVVAIMGRGISDGSDLRTGCRQFFTSRTALAFRDLGVIFHHPDHSRHVDRFAGAKNDFSTDQTAPGLICQRVG